MRERIDVRQHDPLAAALDQTFPAEFAERLIDGLARRTHERREIRLRERDVDHHAIPVRPSEALRELGEHARDADSDRAKHQILDARLDALHALRHLPGNRQNERRARPQ